MLAVSSDKFKVPFRTSESAGWVLESIDGLESTIVNKPFNYTFVFSLTNDDTHYKFTYTYDGASVKPNGRTLRLLGAECTSKIVSSLSRMTYKDGNQWHNLCEMMAVQIVNC
jgi:hypothetical protein